MKALPLAACLLVAAPDTGCNLLLYPLARAFGGPSEAELRACRPAFERLKSTFPTARVVVFPALVAKDAGIPLPGTAERLAEGLRKAGAAQCVAAQAVPAPEPLDLGHNQMRYTWKRARAYAAWVKQAQPDGDFLVFSDFLRMKDGLIHGMMLYVVDRSGQVAFVSLWNTHHFEGGHPPKDAQAACNVMLERFQRALTWEAKRMFPPYGVG